MKYHLLLLLISLIILGFVEADDILETARDKVTLITNPVLCDYKKKDLKEDYDVNSDAVINCHNRFCTSTGKGVTTTAGLVDITSEGTYIVQGSLYGQVRINAPKTDFVHLVLDDSIITSDSGPAIYGVSADKITITVVGNNTLSDSANYNTSDKDNNEPDACVFIESDLSINGSGSLVVSGNYGDAIRSKKDIRIVNANINVLNAVKKGIKAKNSIGIKDSIIKVVSTDTAIKVTKSSNKSKGYIVIDSGSITVSSGKDGIHAENHLTINDGYIDIKESKEGLESQKIDILGGEIHVLSSGDGINASKSKSMEDDGTEDVVESAEYSKDNNKDIYVNITGGKTYITVKGYESDGIDSNGILYIGGEAEVYTSVEGGKVYGKVAALDAEHTNAIVDDATVIITAGEPNAEIVQDDSNKDGKTIQSEHVNESGKVYSNLGQGFIEHLHKIGRLFRREGSGANGSIYHPYVYTTILSQSPGTQITVKNSHGEAIATYTPNVGYSTILITSPKMVAGETYTIILGSTIQTVIASEATSGSVTEPSENSSTKVIENTDNTKIENVNDNNAHTTPVTNKIYNDSSNLNILFDNKTYTEYDNNSIPKYEINDNDDKNNNGNIINEEINKNNINQDSSIKSNTNTNADVRSRKETISEYLQRLLGKSYPEIEKELDEEKDIEDNNGNTNIINETNGKDKGKEDEESQLPKYFHFDISKAGDVQKNNH